MNKKSPYEYLPSYYMYIPELFAFLENSPCTDYIVTIALGDEIINELLQWDVTRETWIWSNDWYEGQKDPSWMGIVALEDVVTYVPDTGDTAYRWKT